MDWEHPLSRAQVRQVDRVAIERFGVPGLVLMENAGRGAVDLLERLGVTGKTVVAAAAGNNGGDGFVMARHLHLRQHDVEVLLCADEGALRGDALKNYQWLRQLSVPIHHLVDTDPGNLFARATWGVDALLGTGAKGFPRPPLDQVLQALNAADIRRLSVDVPSGLDCDTGVAAPDTCRADYTATFVAPKVGFTRGEAPVYLGQVTVLDIGLPAEMVRDTLVEDD